MIYAPLSQNIAVKIYALFLKMFWDWKEDSANVFTFRMYELDRVNFEDIATVVKLLF